MIQDIHNSLSDIKVISIFKMINKAMWDFAAYVLSEDKNIANNVAHTYLALTLGEESYMSKSAVNLWRGSVEEEKGQARTICSYIRELRHPIFALSPDAVAEDINTITAHSLKSIIDKTQENEKLSFEEKDISSLPDNVILQLMLNLQRKRIT